ncbi:receptor-type tyrosine-protein phosphatase u-like isoform x1 [Plakobranchus ocellatus]|uniref:Receptor-type tyrosine-protein phosphatase u-like isoform x1 n=1 Tax=Plakobranchus ocellatus TaxID=259542 RepID=A0AAV4BRM6_9GAST|nr:receptor-type tyrosine-protein phosphatase u-like isoform x1 [Plakobranchus ocellatus]
MDPGRAVPFTLSAEAPTRRVKIRLKVHSQGEHTFNCTSVQSTFDRKAKAAVNFAYPVSLEVLSVHAPCKDAQKSASPQQVDLRLSGSPSATAPVAELKPATKGSLQNSGQLSDLMPPVPITDFEIANIIPSEKLTVCGIHLLGEINCPLGTFGLSCRRQCNCNSLEERCHVATGYCSSGCRPGYEGEDCWTSKLEVGFSFPLDEHPFSRQMRYSLSSIDLSP